MYVLASQYIRHWQFYVKRVSKQVTSIHVIDSASESSQQASLKSDYRIMSSSYHEMSSPRIVSYLHRRASRRSGQWPSHFPLPKQPAQTPRSSFRSPCTILSLSRACLGKKYHWTVLHLNSWSGPLVNTEERHFRTEFRDTARSSKNSIQLPELL